MKLSGGRLLTTLALFLILSPLLFGSPWLLSVGLILFCGLFVAYEFALVKVPVRTLERAVRDGEPGAPLLLQMKQQMNTMLAACQFGITITSLGLTLALEPAIHTALHHYQGLAAYSSFLAMGIGALLHVTFGELVPKGLSLVIPTQVLQGTAPTMRIFRIAAIPFIKTCNAVANAVVKGLTGRNPEADSAHEESMDINEAILHASATGQIEPHQLALMRNVLHFTERTAREVMTPAKDVISLDLQASWTENLMLAEENGYSRYPVIDGDWYRVAGYLRRADLLKAELRGERELRQLLLPIERRPETVHLTQLNLFQGAPIIALYDEYDTFVGLLTAEDVVEQIVGEIYDEGDDRERPHFEQMGEGCFRFDGACLLAEAAEVLGLSQLEEEHQDVDTIGGLVTKLLGRQPRKEDQLTLAGYRVIVEGAQGFRIRTLRFERSPSCAPPEAGI
ncbi:MAG TPA: hemolysin family protein [Symbiobacteriaceae bacterium]|nr:hemolysin family protein [Symbiobacteriaceae bacterium]